ncbi:hypothetical protein LCGC14_1986620 [marine sediment metagenome]|uniref:Uncharacterized protein n=1 Tax=marine sediment metagenome TaxID=412755 RepID=A0A0F9FVE4_9ZZZZ
MALSLDVEERRFKALYRDLCKWADKVSIVGKDGIRRWKAGWW